MKKAICLTMIISIICVAFIPMALAQQALYDTTLDLSSVSQYENTRSLCWVGDTLYILGANAIYKWDMQNATPNVFYDLTSMTQFQYMQNEPQDPALADLWRKSVGYLFTDNNQLFGIHPYSGSIYMITEEKMELISTLPADYLLVESDTIPLYRDIIGGVKSDQEVYLLLTSDNAEEQESTEMICIDLNTESVRTCTPQNIYAIFSDDNGKLLIAQRNEQGGYNVSLYNPESDSLGAPIMSSAEFPADGLAWYAHMGQLICYDNGRVTCSEADGTSKVKAYIPNTQLISNVNAACSSNGLYAYPVGKYIFIRNIATEREVEPKVLNILGNVKPDLIIEFASANPDITVTQIPSTGADQLMQAIMTGDANVDLIVTTAPGTFADIKNKGYISPLNDDSALVDMAKQLYPAIQNVIFEQDALMGYPITLRPMSWTVNETRWNEIGLGEYPLTYEQLFSYIAIWLDEYAVEYPDETLSDFQQSSISMIVDSLIKEYIILNETPESQLTFNTPAFRQVLQCLCEHSALLSEENEQWGMPLLFSYYQGFGYSYNDSDKTKMISAPKLETSSPSIMSADIEVMCINAAPEQQEAARKFISFYAQNLDITTQYMMNPNLNEPYRNPSYETRISIASEEIDLLKKEIETASSQQQAKLMDELSQQELKLQSLINNQWQISPESISVYRELAESLTIPYQSSYLGNGENGGYRAINDVIHQFCDNGIDESEIDAFISELDRVTYMVFMENQ